MNIGRIVLWVLLFLLPAVLCASECLGESWKLPAKLNDSNTSIGFVVDSTWHTVRGTTRGITGQVVLTDPNDPLSIKADVSIPVQFFNTDGESRDERLQEVMASNLFATVSFTSERLSDSCSPKSIAASGRCRGTLQGALTIRDVQTRVQLPVEITEEGEGFVIKGDLPIKWADFNVEDPSILIAKLDPTVTISYRTVIPIYR